MMRVKCEGLYCEWCSLLSLTLFRIMVPQDPEDAADCESFGNPPEGSFEHFQSGYSGDGAGGSITHGLAALR